MKFFSAKSALSRLTFNNLNLMIESLVTLLDLNSSSVIAPFYEKIYT